MKTVMKSLLFCVFFCPLMKINKALAQSRFSIAPVAGVVRGNVIVNNYFNDPVLRDKGYGLLIGVVGHYFLKSRWSISIGANYHRVNFYRNTPNGGKGKKIYWNIPILLNYKPSIRAFSPYFSAGAALSSRSSILNVAIPEPKIPISLDIMIGAGVIYKSNSRVNWIIQPVWQKEVAPKPSNLILPNYNAHKISLQIQMLFQL